VQWVEDGKAMVVDPADHKQATADAIRRWAQYGVGVSAANAQKLFQQELTGPDLLALAKTGNDKIEAKLIVKPYELSGGAAIKLAAAISRLTPSQGGSDPLA
jgi:hypothetical protein